MDDVQKMKEWHEKAFLPWKAEAEKVLGERKVLDETLRGNMFKIQAVLGMLLDGRTRAAVMAWNALGIHPALRDAKVGDSGDVISLVTTSGDVRVVTVEEMVAWLEGL